MMKYKKDFENEKMEGKKIDPRVLEELRIKAMLSVREERIKIFMIFLFLLCMTFFSFATFFIIRGYKTLEIQVIFICSWALLILLLLPHCLRRRKNREIEEESVKRRK
ncbi:MAG: hypothetical protein AB1485_05580 [Candidatus Thermoplasmatota archaeon]